MSTAASRPLRPRRAARTGIAPTPPLALFLTENLLEARRGSCLPTNLAGPDEDVNIYLALRLGELARGSADPRVVPGLDPVVAGPPLGGDRRSRADWYRANADHRLLNLGLFERGDALRRRDIPWGLTRGQSRRRDLAVAATCYGAAADLLARGPGGAATGLVMVLRKLAAGCDDYVQVLGMLAVRRLGLGARLDERDLSGLLPPPGTVSAPAGAGPDAAADAAAVKELLTAVPAAAADIVLDLWLEYRRTGDPALGRRGERLASAAGLPWPLGSTAT
ncbi:MAG: hypothetical protein IPK64_13645 [bacterium]|nr:hypothetical protein [bacterium]